MNHSLTLLAGAASLALSLNGCCPQAPSQSQQWTDAEIEQKINDILPKLTIDEKVALCHAQSKFSSAGVARLGIPELWMSDGPHGVRDRKSVV